MARKKVSRKRWSPQAEIEEAIRSFEGAGGEIHVADESMYRDWPGGNLTNRGYSTTSPSGWRGGKPPAIHPIRVTIDAYPDNYPLSALCPLLQTTEYLVIEGGNVPPVLPSCINPDLALLALNEAGLTALPRGLDRLQDVSTLHLTNNAIEDFSGLESARLRTLVIAGNPVRALPEPRAVPNLQHLVIGREADLPPNQALRIAEVNEERYQADIARGSERRPITVSGRDSTHPFYVGVMPPGASNPVEVLTPEFVCGLPENVVASMSTKRVERRDAPTVSPRFDQSPYVVLGDASHPVAASSDSEAVALWCDQYGQQVLESRVRLGIPLVVDYAVEATKQHHWEPDLVLEIASGCNPTGKACRTYQEYASALNIRG